MSRWIDADALIEKKWQTESEACFYALEDVVSVTDIEETPSIDLVRCKECKYLAVETEDEGTSWYYCTPNGHEVDETDFCSWGKREESE